MRGAPRPDLMIVFHVEPADRGVGIMAEGFSAWEVDGTSWCNCTNVEPMAFEWFDNETGEACEPPKEEVLIEGALRGFITTYYTEIG